jgi:hypothetical protein
MTLPLDVRTEPRRPAALLTRRLLGHSYALTWLLAASAVLAAGGSLFFPGLLAGAPVTDGNLRGTALVVLVVAVPMLLSGLAVAARGSARGLVVWLGAVVYLTYQGVLFCFATPMNNLFLTYVAVLGLGLWTIVTLLVQVDPVAFRSQVREGMPYKVVAWVLGVLAALNALAWLARILPATFSDNPRSLLAGSGLLTNPIFVQDLAVWIPAGLVAAVLVWHRQVWGVLLAASLLAFYVIEGVSVASDQWWGARADGSFPAVASMAVVPGALAAAVITAVPLVWCMRHLRL